jgi:hypothetical protein
VPKKSKDSYRIWMWWFLAAVAASQLYIFWELLAALTLFFMASVPIALLIAGFCVARSGWVMASARFAELDSPRVNLASRRERSKPISA